MNNIFCVAKILQKLLSFVTNKKDYKNYSLVSTLWRTIMLNNYLSPRIYFVFVSGWALHPQVYLGGDYSRDMSVPYLHKDQ